MPELRPPVADAKRGVLDAGATAPVPAGDPGLTEVAGAGGVPDGRVIRGVPVGALDDVVPPGSIVPGEELTVGG